jgi:hypothetical protein
MLGVRRNKLEPLTIHDRLESGNLTVDEVCWLRNCSRVQFYRDRRAGLVAIEKIGRRSVVRGPVAKRYIAFETAPNPGQ